MNFETQLETITKEINDLLSQVNDCKKEIESLDHNFTESYEEIKSKAQIESDKQEVSPIPFVKLLKKDMESINQENLILILDELLKI